MFQPVKGPACSAQHRRELLFALSGVQNQPWPVGDVTQAHVPQERIHPSDTCWSAVRTGTTGALAQLLLVRAPGGGASRTPLNELTIQTSAGQIWGDGALSTASAHSPDATSSTSDRLRNPNFQRRLHIARLGRTRRLSSSFSHGITLCTTLSSTARRNHVAPSPVRNRPSPVSPVPSLVSPIPADANVLRSDLVMCRKQPGISIGRVCDKCDGKCPVCDSYVRPTTLVRICDECSFGNYQNKCVVCGGEGISDAFYCFECTRLEKDRDGCPKIINLGSSRTDVSPPLLSPLLPAFVLSRLLWVVSAEKEYSVLTRSPLYSCSTRRKQIARQTTSTGVARVWAGCPFFVSGVGVRISVVAVCVLLHGLGIWRSRTSGYLSGST